MPSLAVTGVIGSGKSLLLRKLADLLKATAFSADEENRRLLDGDARVREAIISQLGSSCYGHDGKADREELFRLIQTDPMARNTLEGILHPRISGVWRPLAEEHRRPGSAFFLAEIPLLHEKGLGIFFDKTIAVGCSDRVRFVRLAKGRHILKSKSRQWISLQQSQDEKAAKADFLIWNDGSEQQLDRQVKYLSTLLDARS
jgi:dephospho-CoA kinase